MANQRIGFLSAWACAPTMRASVGVISGRSATLRPPLSSNAYSCCTISSPLLSVYSSNGSSGGRSEEHTSELQSPCNLVCRLLLEKKKKEKTRDVRRVLFQLHHTSLCITS